MPGFIVGHASPTSPVLGVLVPAFNYQAPVRSNFVETPVVASTTVIVTGELEFVHPT